MKALTKKKILVMINTLYEKEDDIIYVDSLNNHMETYGDDYYYNREYGEFELININKNWK